MALEEVDSRNCLVVIPATNTGKSVLTQLPAPSGSASNLSGRVFWGHCSLNKHILGTDLRSIMVLDLSGWAAGILRPGSWTESRREIDKHSEVVRLHDT